jgi:chemotaxis protein MotB
VNEPLKVFQAFLEPADLTPDLLSLGSEKLIMYHIAHELGELAKNVEITRDEIKFDLPESVMFQKFSSEPAAQFVPIMEKIKILTTGLDNSEVNIQSVIYVRGYPQEKRSETNKIAGARLDLVKNQVSSTFENGTNTLKSDTIVTGQNWSQGTPAGYLRFSLKQKPQLPDGSKPREIKGALGSRDSDTSVYDEFVRRMSESVKKKKR